MKRAFIFFLKVVICFSFRLIDLFSSNSSKNRSFLIPVYTGLGNLILKTPFFRELRHQFPEARIDVLCNTDDHFRCANRQIAEGVFSETPWVDDILSFPTHASFWRIFSFYWKIRCKYDTIFLFFDTASVKHPYYGSLIAGIKNRIGHTLSKKGENKILALSSFLTVPVELRKKTHEVDLNFDLLKAISPFCRISYDQHVFAANSYSPQLEYILRDYSVKAKQYIVVQLAAANAGKTPKVWLREHFQALISMILEKGDKVIVAGDLSEKSIIEEMIRPYRDRVLNFAGRTSVTEVALLIKNARGLVCHDSGLMHMGNALNTPLIAIFGPTDYLKNRPLGKYSRFLRLNLPCSPCMGLNGYWREDEAVDKCSHSFRCMRETLPESVFEALYAGIRQSELLV